VAILSGETGGGARAGYQNHPLEGMQGGYTTLAPGLWYYSPAKAFEPHHGKTPPIALLIRAVDIK